MAASDFSNSDLIKKGWGTTKANFVSVLVILGAFLIYSLLSSVVKAYSVHNLGLMVLINIVFAVIGVVLEVGLIRIILDIVDGKKPDYSDLYKNYSLFLNFFLTALLVGIVVIVGFILLIIPGFYLAVKYQFYSFVAVDKNLGPMGNFKAAGKLTDGKWMKLFLFDLSIIGLNVLGALALGIGLIITIPISFFAAAYLYRKLS